MTNILGWRVINRYDNVSKSHATIASCSTSVNNLGDADAWVGANVGVILASRYAEAQATASSLKDNFFILPLIATINL
jgi:hypothetical protein